MFSPGFYLLSRLSKRELEILNLLSRGLLYKEIASETGIKKETVKKHLQKVYSKLQVQNKGEVLGMYWQWKFFNSIVYN